MSDIPVRPPPPPPPLPPGWTEHKAPNGHVYYYNNETKKSTYARPLAETPQPYQPVLPAAPAPYATAQNYDTGYDAQSARPTQPSLHSQSALNDFIFASAPKQFPKHDGAQSRGGHRGGMRGGHSNFNDRRRERDDRPKHRQDIPNCAPWVLVRTKFGRRFVWNKETNKSFWKFPPNVMSAVIEFDRKERERKERRERGEPSDVEDEQDDVMAEVEADLAAAEEEMEIVEVDGEEGMENDEEYEEVEVTDDEDGSGNASKRQRTEEPTGDQAPEMGEDDLAWQLAQMEEMEMGQGYDEQYDDEEEPALSEEDCKALFRELLDDKGINPFTPWDKILDEGVLYDDERYKALPNMAARKECFNEWSRDKAQFLKEEKAKQAKRDPRIPYLAFLDRHATPKLYWPEFRRKYKKEPEIKDTKLSDKDKEKLYRDHIKRLAMRSSDLKADLTALLRAQPLALLNRETTLDTLPSPVLSDLRFISLPPATREPLITTYLSTLPPAPSSSTAYSAEEEAQRAKKLAERERREKALADRERRVREEKRRQERDLAYGKGRLREEEEEIERAMKVGREGLKKSLEE